VATLWAGHWDEAAPAGDRSAAATDKRADRERVFYRHLLDSVSIVPGASVAIASGLHPRSFTVPGRFINQALFNERSSATHQAYAMYVSPNYFRTLEIPLQQGRDFDARDVLTSAPVVIVSASLAAQLFPAGNALGQFIAWKPFSQEQPWWREIVGIVGDTQSVLEDQADLPTVYFDLSQMTRPFFSRVIATSSSGTTALVPALRRAVLAADQFADVADVQSMEQVVADMLYPRRAAVFMLLAGGIVGMFLAAVGIYGVISHSVAQRMHELGIRSTLGADRRRMLMLVIREALLVGSAGAALGLGFAVTALRTTAHLVGPVPTFDAITFVVVPIVALVVILAASYGPARRAARLDPMQVLRQS
jgi:putative ABC transport system permease protein